MYIYIYKKKKNLMSKIAHDLQANKSLTLLFFRLSYDIGVTFSFMFVTETGMGKASRYRDIL